MKKKVNIFGKSVPVLLIALIAVTGFASAALLTYFGVITGSVLVSQGLLVDGQSMPESGVLTDGSVTMYSLEAKTVSSELPHSLTNNANVNALVDLDTVCTFDTIVAGGSCPEVKTSYVGTLQLTKKTVVFGQEVWEIPVGADKVQIEYTVVGDKFSAEVVTEDVTNTDYVLIYYADNVDRFIHPEKAILVEDVLGNLPYTDDENIVNDYSAEYPTTPHGAKIWYVPSNAIDSAGELDWARASEFYFESSLIQFNTAGQITVYPTEVLDFSIESDFPQMTYPGTYTITTKVLPA